MCQPFQPLIPSAFVTIEDGTIYATRLPEPKPRGDWVLGLLSAIIAGEIALIVFVIWLANTAPSSLHPFGVGGWF